jgi:hypothetical protein
MSVSQEMKYDFSIDFGCRTFEHSIWMGGMALALGLGMLAGSGCSLHCSFDFSDWVAAELGQQLFISL